MRYEEEGRKLIREAGARARALGHSYVGSGHLLMALAAQPGAAGSLLRQSGAEPKWLEELAEVLWGRGKALPLAQGFTETARSILRGAAREASYCRSREVKPIHILLSLTRRRNCHGIQLLMLCGIDPAGLFSRTVEHILWEKVPVRKKEAVNTKLLEQFSEDLVLKAANMDPVIGREREIDMVIGILSRRNKNNPALVGEPGVGKTAIAEGLAQRMAAGEVPPQLRDKRLISLNMANLVAGTKYRGEFEERLRDVLAEIRRAGDV
ncbi:MAG: ATP-dependent Clp protease ATP-binding subunit, partial [Oscillospiraceae bacterium]|nr:ATP-dependent Clp protease ATP-binding subunit [Oscillospiraceae bacterium]